MILMPFLTWILKATLPESAITRRNQAPYTFWAAAIQGSKKFARHMVFRGIAVLSGCAISRV